MTGSAHAADRTYSATVTAVTSGDTLVVRAGNRDRPLRLFGIDTPEVGQPFGHLARARTSELASAGRVTVYAMGQDPRGRTLAIVRLPDGRDLGHALVVDGLARWDRQDAPQALGLEQAEAQARAVGRGLWRGTAGEPAPGR